MNLTNINNQIAKLRNDILIKQTKIMVEKNPSATQLLQTQLKKIEFEVEIAEINKKILQLSVHQ